MATSTPTAATGRAKAGLRLLLPVADAADVEFLRARYGVAADGIAAPAVRLEPEAARKELLEALGETRQPGLSKLAAAARTAGGFDATLGRAVLERARPARAVGGLLPGTPGLDDELAAAVRELVDRTLGENPARWLAAVAALPAYRKTLPELLAETASADVAADGDSGAATAAPAKVPAKAARAAAAATVRLLLAQAAPQTTGAVLTGLSDLVLADVLAAGTPSTRLVETLLSHGGHRERLALANHPKTPPTTLKRLLADHDPILNAAVYRNPNSTPSLRRAVASDQAAGIDPGLRAWLLSAASHRTSADTRRNLAPLLACGDPELTEFGLKHYQDARAVHQVCAVLRVLERQGLEVTRAFATRVKAKVSLKGDASRAIGRMLRPGKAEPLDILRERTEAYEDPHALLRRLLSRDSYDQEASTHSSFQSPYTYDPVITASACRSTPPLPQAARYLRDHEDTDEADRAFYGRIVVNSKWQLGGSSDEFGDPTPPIERLAEHGALLTEAHSAWTSAVARSGELTSRHLLDEVRPARAALLLLDAASEAAWSPGGAFHEAVTELQQAAAQGMAGTPGAWQIFFNLLPEFTGTLPELLAVSGQVADA
jgi:hypothetical protein